MHINVILFCPPEARKAALTTAEARGIGRYQDQSDSAPFVVRREGMMANLLEPDFADTQSYSVCYRRQSYVLIKLEVRKRLGRRLMAPRTSRFKVLQFCYTTYH